MMDNHKKTTFSFSIGEEERSNLLRQRPHVIWFTGPSGSGKSTLANELEKKLISQRYNTFILDGDSLREGLCRDLGFTEEDRKENIRRVAEVSKLFLNAGVIVLTAFISPHHQDREMAKKIIGPSRFTEIYLNCPIEFCEQRDPKGLYKLARKGLIKNFTGIDSPYEIPINPDFKIDTSIDSIEICTSKIIQFLSPKLSNQEATL